jgi:hypothetical protein
VGAASARHLVRRADVGRHRPFPVARQAWQSVSTRSPYRLSPIWSHPSMACISATATAGAPLVMPVDTRWALQMGCSVLILDRRDGVHRGISFPMCRTPGKGGGVPHSMQQPWCSRGAGAVFSWRSLKLATIHLVSPICGDGVARWSRQPGRPPSSRPVARICGPERRSGTWSAALTVRSPSAEPAFTDVG